MTNDVLIAFFVGIAVGIIIGVIMFAVSVAVRNNEDLRIEPVTMYPTPLENLDGAISHCLYLRDQFPQYSPEWVRLNNLITELRKSRTNIKLQDKRG